MVLQQLVQVYDSSEFTDRQCHESTLFCILTSQKQDLTEKKISLAGHCVWPPFKNKIILSQVKYCWGNPLLDWYLSMRNHKHSGQLYATEAM